MRIDVEGRLRFRLTFADMDLVQFFFADYYRWMERAFAELLAECGCPRARMYADGVGFPVVESGCKHEERAVIDEQLDLRARFVDMSNRSFRVGYEFTKLDGSLVATGYTQHVCVDLDAMKARPVPDELRESGKRSDD